MRIASLKEKTVSLKNHLKIGIFIFSINMVIVHSSQLSRKKEKIKKNL